MTTPLLQVKDLQVEFETGDGTVRAVNNLNFELMPGDVLGIVGESGSGKSQTVLSLMGLLADNGKASGSVLYHDREILNLPKKDLNQIRGEKISMIFQDPMTCLNPYVSIAKQMAEVLILHKSMSFAEARLECIRMLDAVRIPDAAKRVDMYSHEFSGGMRQRVMIAMALLCKPDLLIADEPTTALDVTVQAQILDLMTDLKNDFNTSIILITHDLGVVAGICDDVLVMYGGQVMEHAPLEEIFYRPQHPYTEGLLKSIPRLDETEHTRLATIPGNPPNLLHLPAGCPFYARCEYRLEQCENIRPQRRELNAKHDIACHLEALASAEKTTEILV
ncbi:MAG: ATP-binding cassette domain-containing protein [Gammaproteobacteria bacterium]|nr:ATP-binding cassette domain-containing protein [Gammaproteobacteria bacterium]NNC98013.1 ATP-binding cassette domain-containing protein [Gammaproteobacteria bacterium]NNM13752.1 ATP-binding cassette domain-containing protein [Gammaproteobacteria bacterium]